MMTYKIFNFGKSLDAGMRVPSIGAVSMLPPESTAVGAGRDTPSVQGKTVLISPKMSSFTGYGFPHI